ncbi:hypothetical protein RJ60_05625 [Mesotoga sp. B105.6.4]|nr:hypothetical protein RJ60_05625 [Mesotoga sp. B105.6.4]
MESVPIFLQIIVPIFLHEKMESVPIFLQIISEAFKRYTQLPSRDIPMISKYAKLMRVEKKLSAYLEVLL